MVDAQTVQHAVAQQLENEAVSVIEQLRQFHAQAGELVDVEEASVIDVVGGNAEMRRAPVLILDQCVQLAPSLEAPRLAVDPVDRRLHRFPHVAALPRERAELGLQVLGALSNARAPVRQAGKGVTQPLEFRVLVAEHAMVVQRTNRQLVRIVGPHGEAAGLRVEAEHELARFQHRPVLVAEQRHQQLVMQIASVRVPIDVEPAGVFGCWAPFQHVEPPRIIGAADAHMVGHEIEHLTETAVAKRRSPCRGTPTRRRAPD